MKKIVLVVMILLFGSSVALAAASKEERIAQGKALFNDPAFAGSTNEKSCNSCHPDGKGIRTMSKKDYAEMINRCIVGALQGEVLETDSEEMEAMQAYLLSLAK